MITREQVEARLAQLKAEQAGITAAMAQMQANISAFQGAIEDCEFWLAAVSTETPKQISPLPFPSEPRKIQL